MGLGCSRRCAPGCALRGPWLADSCEGFWEGFWPWLGGVLELSGVFGGRPSLASSSPTRALKAAICRPCFGDGVRLRRDGFRLGQNQADQRFPVERFKNFTIHPKLESGPTSLVKKRPPGDSPRHQMVGREQLRFL